MSAWTSLTASRPTPFRAIAISTGIEIRLEDRLKHQLGSGLHRPVPYRRDAERTLAFAPRLRDHHPPHRCWSIRLLLQLFPDARQPLFEPLRFDRCECHPIYPRCAVVRTHQVIGVAQDVAAIDLVVEQVEAEVRFCLCLEIQLPLEGPDLTGRLQAHRQSPILISVRSTPEVRVLPSAGVTRLHRSYDPVRLPQAPPPSGDVEAATLVPN